MIPNHLILNSAGSVQYDDGHVDAEPAQTKCDCGNEATRVLVTFVRNKVYHDDVCETCLAVIRFNNDSLNEPTITIKQHN